MTVVGGLQNHFDSRILASLAFLPYPWQTGTGNHRLGAGHGPSS